MTMLVGFRRLLSVQKKLAFCVVTLLTFCAFTEQPVQDKKQVSFRRFLSKQQKKLSLIQKMQIARDLLSEVEQLHQNEPVYGPIRYSHCFVATERVNHRDRYAVTIQHKSEAETPVYSIGHHVQNIGWMLAKITDAKKYSRDKKVSMLPTYKRFKHLISNMKNPDVQVRKSVPELLVSLETLIKDHKLIRHATKNADLATRAILKKCRTNGLSKKEIFKLALFIESELPKRIEQEGRYYFSRRMTGLSRTIEVDPKNSKVYIHLKNHGVKELGHGARKVVTRSIMYSPTRPRIVAFSETTYPNDKETQAIIDLQGLPGLYKVISILDRKDKDGNPNSAFVSKYYSRGDLAHFMKKSRGKFSFNDKIRFARDILIGLESMHTRGYSHRDLGLKNYFVERRGKKFIPVIADFGRAAYFGDTNERGAQGGYSLCAPEGLDYNSLQGDDYFATDIYALGCVFYRILFSRKPSWHDPETYGDPSLPVSLRQEKLCKTIEQYRKRRTERLGSRYMGSRSTSSRLRFEKVILKMIDPDPKKRGTATEHRQMLDAIVKRK